MAIFKCKMCGGDLTVQEGFSIAQCTYCGTQQTLPKTRDDNVANLFNVANAQRAAGEFDKAEETYQKIIELDTTEAEAHWGAVLSRYGIEYVEDPVTGKRTPTCHRASYDAVAADVDYLAALQYGDAVQQAMYQQEARLIDDIQRQILAVSQNEPPFDVFICYKETDPATGLRTEDSVTANEIYYQLTNVGYKVFYAPITLEDKLGTEYEPYIFAALNSAKVMLAVGSKKEYFEAPWVRNEWSRFLKIIKKDPRKKLFPCYKNMSAYDLPAEFAHLQAQDMSKIGFITDIIHGIQKIMELFQPQAQTVQTVQQTQFQNVQNTQQNGGMYSVNDYRVDGVANRVGTAVKNFVNDKQLNQPFGTKDKWIAFVLCLFGGYLGLHKFYEGKTAMGVLYILTGGLLMIGWICDIFKIISLPRYYCP